MPLRLRSSIGTKRLALNLVVGLLLSTLLTMGSAQASFRAFLPAEEGNSLPNPADGRATPVPSIQAYHLTGDDRIKLDGHLDDGAWTKAQSGNGFKVWEPDRGTTPSEDTVFKVAYDEDAIYFGVACIEKDPSKITARLSRRDRFSNSDVVSVYIDPYLDHTTGYNFQVNPLGVLLDSYMYNDGDRDDNWDAVWEAQTYRDQDGWYVEMKIPFSAIRYRTAPSMTWGLDVYRTEHGRGLESAWVTWDRAAKGFVSRWGQVTGIQGIPSPRQLEIMPYTLTRFTDPSASFGEKKETFGNMGADLKYGVTADLALNATVQPDFGQVEADPATLNLSPFETFYDEKRPFFIEGSQLFGHPDFNLFYSRRIGTGDPNSRIRYAAKLTGKAAGNTTIAALDASSDITGRGQAHNLLKNGDRLSRYFVGRFGRQFNGGLQRFNLMGTATLNTANRDVFGDYASREAYTGGVDFDLFSKNRTYNIQGSVVSSIVDPEASASESTDTGAKSYGSGGSLDIRKVGGQWRTGVNGRWESAKLDINDLGYLQAPDEIDFSGYITNIYNPEGKSKTWNQGNMNLNFWKNWLYGARKGYDINTGQEVWSYGRGHKQWAGGEWNGWRQRRDYSEVWSGINFQTEGTRRYETRGGPLMREPETFGGWLGWKSDTRKPLIVRVEGNHFRDTSKNHDTDGVVEIQWNQSSAMNHDVTLNFHNRKDDTQWIDPPNGAAWPVQQGIGGVSYVFGRIHQQTASVTLRTSLLFSRDKSLEVYAQPFITVGDYSELRELLHADTYDFAHYVAGGYQPQDFNFSYTAVNWNVVYRWEYRPGSTIFLVWTQGRQAYDQRNFHGTPGGFRNDMRVGSLFGNEPENKVLAKITYWFAI